MCKACLDLIPRSKDDCLMTKCFLLHVVCCAAQPILRERAVTESYSIEIPCFPGAAVAGQAYPTPLSEGTSPWLPNHEGPAIQSRDQGAQYCVSDTIGASLDNAERHWRRQTPPQPGCGMLMA